jgi:tellurite resistance protein TerC
MEHEAREADSSEPDPYWLVYRAVRRLVVAVVGLSLVAVGLALVVLPGPALLLIPAGLAVLAIEFEWARRLLRRIRAQLGGDDKPS